jgi:lipoprotein NlpI
MDPWDHMKNGNFSGSIEAYSLVLKEKVTTFNLFNRALAFINSGDLSAALRDMEEAELIYCEDPYHKKNNHLTDSYRNFIGVVHWIAGNPSLALTVWGDLLTDHESRKISYTDAAGGVESPCLAWLAGKTQDDSGTVMRAERFLKKRLRAKQATAWPGAIAQYLLGNLSEEELLELSAAAPSLATRHQCQANFWVGMVANLVGEHTKATKALLAASESGALLDEEFYLAQYEYKKLTSGVSSQAAAP